MNVLSAGLIAGLIVLAIGLALLWARFSAYRATHPDTVSEIAAKRRASAKGSRSVNLGLIKQHLAPLLPDFAEKYDFKDARFMGDPIDYLVFDGLESGEVKRLVLVEIKTGKAALNDRQRLVKDAVKNRCIPVEWDLVRLDRIALEDESVLPEGALNVLDGDSPPAGTSAS